MGEFLIYFIFTVPLDGYPMVVAVSDHGPVHSSLISPRYQPDLISRLTEYRCFFRLTVLPPSESRDREMRTGKLFHSSTWTFYLKMVCLQMLSPRRIAKSSSGNTCHDLLLLQVRMTLCATFLSKTNCFGSRKLKSKKRLHARLREPCLWWYEHQLFSLQQYVSTKKAMR